MFGLGEGENAAERRHDGKAARRFFKRQGRTFGPFALNEFNVTLKPLLALFRFDLAVVRGFVPPQGFSPLLLNAGRTFVRPQLLGISLARLFLLFSLFPFIETAARAFLKLRGQRRVTAFMLHPGLRIAVALFPPFKKFLLLILDVEGSDLREYKTPALKRVGEALRARGENAGQADFDLSVAEFRHGRFLLLLFVRQFFFPAARLGFLARIRLHELPHHLLE